MNVLIILQHVRGHQDKNTAFALLSQPAQLNVFADELASSTIMMTTPNYQEYDANRVSLVVNGYTITSKATPQLREASLSQQLREYLTQKYNWKSTIPDLIWWKVHGKAIGQLADHEKIQIHKFIYKRLATNQREFMYKKRFNENCASCDNVETHDHLIRCGDPPRVKIKDDMMLELHTVSQKHKAPREMHTAFVAGITSWINDDPIPDISVLVPNASRQLIKTFRKQTAIGWDQIFNGRLAHSWSSFINHVIDNPEIDSTKYTSAETWGTAVILTLWRHTLLLWKARNNAEHGSDATEKSTIRKIKLMEVVSDIQSKEPVENHVDQQYIARSVTEIEKMTNSHITVWIHITTTLQKLDLKKKKNSETTGHIHPPHNNGRRVVKSRPHSISRDIGIGTIRL